MSPHRLPPSSPSVADRSIARLDGAVKTYGKLTALDGAQLQIHRGELLALLGPNGAGKTTAIGLLLGLIRADAGTVELFGQDPQRIQARRRIGVMLQSAALPATLRVGELLRLTASYYPSPRPLAETAQLAGIGELLQRWRCAAGPSCCFWTSRRSAWISRFVKNCGQPFASWSPKAARCC
jgi:ABC-2 type transport system ATP-binding protein